MGAWGADSNGIADLIDKIKSNRQTVMYILPIRKLTATHACELATALSANTTMEEFYCSGHAIGHEGLRAFGEMLKVNKTLKRICVGNSDTGDEGLELLCAGIAENNGLTSLDLELKGFGLIGAQALGRALSSNGTITSLNVSRNDLNDQAIDVLCQGLKCSAVSTLNLNENAFTDAGVLALVDLLATTKIHHLSLAHNNLRDRQVELGSALQSLTFANLEACHLTEAFIQSFCKAAAGSMEELNLNRNSLGVEGAQALAVLLETDTCCLKRLCMGHNGITDAGAIHLAHSLQNEAHGLRYLDLSANELTHISMKDLFKVTGLEELRLFDNRLGQGVTHVVSTLAINSSIRVLDLCANGLDGEWAAALFDGLWTNTTLQVVEMGGNDLQEQGRTSLKQLREHNPNVDVAIDKSISRCS